jgi:hypothetical protein
LFLPDAAEAARTVERCRQRAAGLLNPSLAVLVEVADGIATYARGDHAAAAGCFGRALLHAEHAGPYPRAIVAWTVAVRAAAPDFGVDAASAYHEAISLLRDLQEWANLWFTVESLATWWCRTGQLEEAATTLGFLESSGRAFFRLERRRARASEIVDANPEATRWRAAGAAMTRDEILDYCLERLRTP